MPEGGSRPAFRQGRCQDGLERLSGLADQAMGAFQVVQSDANRGE